jgi:hypothetical protein
MRFGLIDAYPGRASAEREFIARCVHVADRLGHEAIGLSPDGRRLDSEGRIGATVDPSALDFVVALHHDAPKTLPVYTYGALWIPLREDPGAHVANMRNILSWDDRLASDSAIINAHVAAAGHAAGLAQPIAPLVASFTCQRTDHRPRPRTDVQLLYAGTNWDRGLNTTGGGGQVRHEGLLRRLDAAGGVIFHGPDRYSDEQEGAPWAGFANYRGPLPFDGVSMIEALAQAGACLALTSRRHRRDQVLSARVFEACAAGVPAIVDMHKGLEAAFGDTLLYVNSEAPADVLADAILGHLDWMKSRPDEASDMARAAQAIFHDGRTLDDLISGLCARHAARTEAFAPGAVVVITPVRDAEDAAALPGLQACLEAQRGVVVRHHVVSGEAATRPDWLAAATAGLRDDAPVAALAPQERPDPEHLVLLAAMLDAGADLAACPTPDLLGSGRFARPSFEWSWTAEAPAHVWARRLSCLVVRAGLIRGAADALAAGTAAPAALLAAAATTPRLSPRCTLTGPDTTLQLHSVRRRDAARGVGLDPTALERIRPSPAANVEATQPPEDAIHDGVWGPILAADAAGAVTAPIRWPKGPRGWLKRWLAHPDRRESALAHALLSGWATLRRAAGR